jgi:hypothetical protein
LPPWYPRESPRSIRYPRSPGATLLGSSTAGHAGEPSERTHARLKTPGVSVLSGSEGPSALPGRVASGDSSTRSEGCVIRSAERVIYGRPGDGAARSFGPMSELPNINANWSQTIPAAIDKPGKQVVVETFSLDRGSPVILKIGLDTGESEWTWLTAFEARKVAAALTEAASVGLE